MDASFSNTLKKINVLVTAMLLCLGSESLLAYGPTGHRVVAQVAENHLTPKAKEAVSALLKGRNLTQIATWVADKEAIESSEFWKKAQSRWHSVHVQTGEQYQKTSVDKQGDAFIALEAYMRTLKSPTASNQKKAFALKFITHLIGDLHQPIQPLIDKEGDYESLEVEWMGQEIELRSIWENELLTHQQLSYSEIAQFSDTKNERLIQHYQEKMPIEWVEESLILRDRLLADVPAELDEKYALKHFPIVKGQLRKAGIRLAGVLNEIFPEPATNAPQGFDVQLEQQASSQGKIR